MPYTFPEFHTKLQDFIQSYEKNNPAKSEVHEIFPIYYIHKLFETPIELAEEATLIAGAGDREVDGYYEFEDVLYIFQFKWTQDPSNKFNDRDISKFLNSYDLLLNPPENEREEFDRLSFIFKEYLEEEKEVRFQYVTTGGFSKAALAAMSSKEQEVSKKYQVSFEAIDLEGMINSLYLAEVAADISPSAAQIENIQNEEVAVMEDRSLLVGCIEARALAELYKAHGNSIFDKNVRYYLSAKTKFNKGMLDTLKKADQKKFFHLYNNGVSLVAKDFDWNAESGTIKMTQPQIVNGGQTTRTLEVAMNKSLLDSDVKVFIKIIKTEDEELENKIAEYNNSQTAVTLRDLKSNDKNLLGLQKNFAEIGFFLEIKRGEFKAKSTSTPSVKKQFSKGDILDIELVAQAAICFLGDPTVAQGKKKLLFDSDHVYYEQIFGKSRMTPEEMICAVNIFSHCIGQKRKIMSEIKSAKKEDDQKALRKLSNLTYRTRATTYFSAMIGQLVKERGLNSIEMMKISKNDSFLAAAYKFCDPVLCSVIDADPEEERLSYSWYKVPDNYRKAEKLLEKTIHRREEEFNKLFA